MKQVSGHEGDTGRPGSAALLSGTRWTRVLLAGVAVHVANVVVPAVLILAYSLLAIGAQGAPVGGSVEGFAGWASTWSLPILTLPAAAWAARGARPESAVLQGLLVGLLVAGTFGLLFFWPNDLRSLAPFALTVVTGLTGGLFGRRRYP